MVAVKKPGRPANCQHWDKICDCESNRMVLMVAIPREQPCQCPPKNNKPECICARCSCFFETRVNKEAMEKAPKVDPSILQQREAISEACHLAERNLATCCSTGGLQEVQNPGPIQRVQLQSPPRPSPNVEGSAAASSSTNTTTDPNQVNSLNNSQISLTTPYSARPPYQPVQSYNFNNSRNNLPVASLHSGVPFSSLNGNYSQAPMLAHQLPMNHSCRPQSGACFPPTYLTPYQPTGQQQQMTQSLPGLSPSCGQSLGYNPNKEAAFTSEAWVNGFSDFQHPHITQYNVPQNIGTRDNPVTLAYQQRWQNDPQFYQEIPENASQGVVGMAAPPAENSSGCSGMTAYQTHICSCGPGCRCKFCIAHPYNESSQTQVDEAFRTMQADPHYTGTTSQDGLVYGPHPALDPILYSQVITSTGHRGDLHIQYQQPINGGSHMEQDWSDQASSNANDTVSPIQTMNSSDYHHIEYQTSNNQASVPPGDQHMTNAQ